MTDLFGETIINHFQGKYAFLSNFYECPVFYEGINFKTAEHAYQWGKTTNVVEQMYVIVSPTPGIAKRRGQEVTLREDWNEIRYKVMLDILRAKFSQNCGLRQALEETGDAILIEGNTWCDNTWGDCSCSKCANKKGENMLGILLMQVREELKEKKGTCLRL